ncbi:MAG: type IV pilus twitching motility protein PilT [Elusimicrobiales bacterium]|nr:type IV pilus twitching motility protein PilT [Elusimicrobiales bacterium]
MPNITLPVLLKVMVQNKASDLHIRGNSPVFLRINGNITPINASSMTESEVEAMIKPLLNPRLKGIYDEHHEVDFSYDGGELGRFRFNIFRHKEKTGVTVRHIPIQIPTLEQLRMPVNSIKKLLENERGIILVTGITGSGKSSTLAAMIDYINQHKSLHIITIEDPIEFTFKEKRSIISQREIGTDTNNFIDALRASLRQDPDIILVGEMRDLETVSAAITAAETGHLVFGTLHTLNAVQTVSRVIDMFPPHQQNQIRLQLSESLKGVISQRLLPCLKGGRVPAVEILNVTPNIKKLIEESNSSGIVEAIEKGSYYGMQSFNQSLITLYNEGMADMEQVLAAATNPDDVRLAIRGITQSNE